MSDSVPGSVLCISYMPYISQFIQEGKLNFWELDRESPPDQLIPRPIEECLEKAESVCGAAACLWCKDKNDQIFPCLLMDHAKELYDEMHVWSEGKLAEWFTIDFVEKDGCYAVAVMPNLQHSVDRFRTNWMRTKGEVLPKDVKMQLIFKPISYVSRPKHMLATVKSKISKRSIIGMVPGEKFNASNIDQLEDRDILEFGPLMVRWNDPQTVALLSAHIDAVKDEK